MEEDQPRRWFPLSKQWIRRFIILVVAGLVLQTSCALVTDRLVTSADRNAPRNPQTGIMLGAEAADLGPVDAPGVVLFVHGFVGAGNNFADLPERLATLGWRVRVMRLPGHGTSPRDMLDLTADKLLDAVRQELRTLQGRYGKVIVIGHSMGGTLSTLAVAEDGADGLVLGAPFFGVTSHWYYILEPETWTRLARPFLPWIYKGQIFLQVNRKEARPEIVSYAWIPHHGLMILYELGRRARDVATLAKITCPVLVIHARGDVAASIEADREAYDAMASTQKQAVWLTRSNHHIFWDYEREEVMHAVETFVGRASHGEDDAL